MGKYIDREKYCEEICSCDKNACNKGKCPIWNAPAENVAPVEESSWGKFGKTRHKTVCRKCGKERPYRKTGDGYFLAWDAPYCPSCGAKIREVEP